MSKVITLRLSDEEYEKISGLAEQEHRPISNFITHTVLRSIQDDVFADDLEMKEITSDKKLMKGLQTAHKQAAVKKGKFVG